jgi:hypothetical protein
MHFESISGVFFCDTPYAGVPMTPHASVSRYEIQIGGIYWGMSNSMISTAPYSIGLLAHDVNVRSARTVFQEVHHSLETAPEAP